jgi:hypothetical protein
MKSTLFWSMVLCRGHEEHYLQECGTVQGLRRALFRNVVLSRGYEQYSSGMWYCVEAMKSTVQECRIYEGYFYSGAWYDPVRLKFADVSKECTAFAIRTQN